MLRENGGLKNRSVTTLFILQTSVLRMWAVFFPHLQRKGTWSEGRLFCPTLKHILQAAFSLLSLCSLVVFLLPIYLHCHTFTSRAFTFRSSSVPCQALGWRWIYTKYNRRVSLKDLHHFLYEFTSIYYEKKKSILSRGKASSCVYSSCVQ